MAPWTVKKQGKKWAIVKKTTGKTVGHSVSKAKAMSSVRARYHAEAGGKFTKT